MHRISTILRFEYLGYVKSTSWRVSTAIFCIILFAASFFPQIKGVIDKVTEGKEADKIVFIVDGADKANGFDDQAALKLLKEAAPKYEWEMGDADDDAKKLVSDAKYNMAVVFDGESSYKLYGTSSDFSVYELTPILDNTLTGARQEALFPKFNPDEQDAIQSFLAITVSGSVVTVSTGGKDGGGAMESFILAYILLYLLFIVVMIYGQFVVNSVVTEKSTKAMELLITSAKPTELMYGKVIGIGLVAVTQIVLMIAFGLTGMLINYSSWKSGYPEIIDGIIHSNFSIPLVILLLVFFALGYLLYAFTFAALGATVSRIEDAGAVTGIPTMLIVACFAVSIASMSDIDSTFAAILSYFPLSAPFMMFSRVAMGEAGALPVIISLALLVLAIVLTCWIAGKIYRVGVMMYGKPMKLGAIIKTVRQGSKIQY
jgi:ABC-2 type transport system permease protein